MICLCAVPCRQAQNHRSLLVSHTHRGGQSPVPCVTKGNVMAWLGSAAWDRPAEPLQAYGQTTEHSGGSTLSSALAAHKLLPTRRLRTTDTYCLTTLRSRSPGSRAECGWFPLEAPMGNQSLAFLPAAGGYHIPCSPQPVEAWLQPPPPSSHGCLPSVSVSQASPSLLLWGPQSLDLGPTLNLGCSHPEVLTFITSVRPHFQMKSHSQVQGLPPGPIILGNNIQLKTIAEGMC